MIRKLLRSVREYKMPSILTPILMVGEAAMEIVIPFLMAYLLDEIQAITSGGQPNINRLLLYGGLMVAAAVFALICGVVGARLSAKASCGFAHNLREDMYNNLQSFSFANIDNYSTASLITRITTDVTNVQNAYQMSIRMLVRAPVLFVSATIMACLVEPIMGLTFVIGAIILGVIVSFCMVKVTPHFRMMFKKYDALNSVVQEDLTAIRVVKSYVREDYQMEKMKHATQEVYNYSIKAEKIFTILMPAVQFVMYATIIVLLVMGSDMAINGWGNVDYSNIQALMTYAMQVLSGVMMVALTLNFIAMSKGSAERIVQVLEEKTTLPKAKEQVTEVKDGSVDFENVEFRYSQKADVAVLKNINIHIDAGQTIGIIGATGSGKSSLVSLIPRLYDPSQGSVKVGGVDVRNYNLDTLRNNVAMVLQKNVLFSGTIAENLRWGDENATDEQVREAAIQACADEFIQNLPGKYEYDLGQGGVNVSGGQKQRLCIARALLKHPKIIIFDDSTSAVDTKTDAIIRDNLKKYAPETTKIIIAQRITSVQDADKIIVLDAGRIVGFGTHEELIVNNEIYKEVYESQIKGGEE